jgi:dGTPase
MPLAPFATLAAQSRGRLVPEEISPVRSPFQRDRDRVIHSHAFRRLRNKTQVFIESEGDYYRTRLTHSIEVAQIARTIARVMQVDEDLAEGLALSHDLGHTCFGHAGEKALNEAMRPYGGFDHNDHAFRLVTKLEQRYAEFQGLNLTWETLEGLIKHNGPVKNPSYTVEAFQQEWDLQLKSHAGIEAQIAALADDIAYNTHDFDDGFNAGLITLEDVAGLPLIGGMLKAARDRYGAIPENKLMYEAVRQTIGLMVDDLLRETGKKLAEVKPQSAEEVRSAGQAMVCFGEEVRTALKHIRPFLMERVYRHPRVNRMNAWAAMLVGQLFEALMNDPKKLPSAWHADLVAEGGIEDTAIRARKVADYIAGMTDRFAELEHNRLFGVQHKH